MRLAFFAANGPNRTFFDACSASFAQRFNNFCLSKGPALTGRTAFLLNMGKIFITKILQSAENGVGGSFAETAKRPYLNSPGQIFQQRQSVVIGIAFNDVVQQPKHLLCPFPTRDTFAAGFILGKLHKKPGNLDNAGILIHYDQAAGANHRPNILNRLKIQRHIQGSRGQTSARWASDLDRFETIGIRISKPVCHPAANLKDYFA
jgi:hypothetical protein